MHERYGASEERKRAGQAAAIAWRTVSRANAIVGRIFRHVYEVSGKEVGISQVYVAALVVASYKHAARSMFPPRELRGA
jgi:hypothetical protein